MQQNRRALEDIEPGQRFESGAHQVTEAEILEFARRYDPQPFHTDPAAARASVFGGLIASGWHAAAITMRLLLEAFPIAGGTIGLGGEAAWPNATRPGDALHVEGEVMEAKPSSSKPDRGVVTVRVETKNQRGEVVQILTAKLLVFRRGAA